MATVRYLVDDVDATLPFYRALGFKLADHWGAPLRGRAIGIEAARQIAFEQPRIGYRLQR